MPLREKRPRTVSTATFPAAWKLLACATVLALALPAAAQDKKGVTLFVEYPEKDIAARACAEAMMETQAIVTKSFPVRVVMRPEPEDDQYTRDMVLSIENSGNANLLAVPFAFRDAVHFMAYLKSNLRNELPVSYGMGNGTPLGYAYGGFSQLFTYDVAVTETKHFNRRAFIGPSTALLYPYEVIRPNWTMGHMLFSPSLDFSSRSLSFYTEAARRMAQDRNNAPATWRVFDGVDIVEAPLLSAFDIGLDKNARFMSLFSSSLRLIYFGEPTWFRALPDGFSQADTLALKDKTIEWVNAAVPVCSAKVYDAELAMLDRLKKAGMQIVPFNRKSVLEQSWKDALSGPRLWTTSQAEALESLGSPDPSTVLPSAVLAKFTAEQKKAAAVEDRKALEYVELHKQVDEHARKKVPDSPLASVEEVRLARASSAASKRLEEKQYDQAIDAFTDVMKLKLDAKFFLGRGDAYFAKKDYDTAIRDYTDAIKLDPDSEKSTNYFEHRGDAFIAKEDYVRAALDFARVKPDNKSEEFLIKRCFLYATAGQIDKAMIDCNAALDNNPFQIRALTSRGFAYLKTGQKEKALADYNAALKVYPKFAPALYGRGQLKQQTGDTAGGDRDIAAARAATSNIADEFAKFGLPKIMWGEVTARHSSFD